MGTNIKIEWTENSGSGSAQGTDNAMILAYNTAKHVTVYEINGAKRVQGTFNYVMPTEWLGDSLELYLGFISEDGSNVSDSLYLSSIAL